MKLVELSSFGGFTNKSTVQYLRDISLVGSLQSLKVA